jgi:hypothetical protein
MDSLGNSAADFDSNWDLPLRLLQVSFNRTSSHLIAGSTSTADVGCCTELDGSMSLFRYVKEMLPESETVQSKTEYGE